MTTPEAPTQLTLFVQAGPDASAEEVDALTRQLRAELQDTEVESAELLSEGAAPQGAKGLDAAALGALAVAVLPPVLPKLVDFVQAWCQRGQGRTVKFKGKIGGQQIEFEGPADELKSLLATLGAPGTAPRKPAAHKPA